MQDEPAARGLAVHFPLMQEYPDKQGVPPAVHLDPADSVGSSVFLIKNQYAKPPASSRMQKSIIIIAPPPSATVAPFILED